MQRSVKDCVGELQKQGMIVELTGDDNAYTKRRRVAFRELSYWEVIAELSDRFEVFPRSITDGVPEVMSDEERWPLHGPRIVEGVFIDRDVMFHAERRDDKLIIGIRPTPCSVGSEVTLANVSLGKTTTLSNGQYFLDPKYGVWSWSYEVASWPSETTVTADAFFYQPVECILCSQSVWAYIHLGTTVLSTYLQWKRSLSRTLIDFLVRSLTAHLAFPLFGLLLSPQRTLQRELHKRTL